MDQATNRYLDVTQEAGAAFMKLAIDGPIVMLNQLRFREIADYSAAPELAPSQPISGAEAYDRYIEHTRPHLARHGGVLLGYFDGNPCLIGPPSERWDRIMLVRQASIASFLAFAQDEAYLAGLGHRMAAL